MNKIDETIDIGANQCGYFAKNECEERSAVAVEKFPEFFGNTEHQTAIEVVKDIVKQFFKVNNGIYVNHRVGTKKTGPFSVVKVDKPVFPNMNVDKKNQTFYEPLKDLGVKIRFNKASGSYLFHID